MPKAPDIVMSMPPESHEVLATAITGISEGVEKLLKSGINRKAIVVLLADATRLGRSDINRVLDAIKDMRRDYCR